MTTIPTGNSDTPSGAPDLVLRPGEPIEEQVKAMGLKPRSIDDLVCDAWESDEELDAFLAYLAESRRLYSCECREHGCRP
jgi:hypothetical protein